MGIGAACDFARDVEVAQAPLMREIERLVRGSDYGATSWTTLAQATRLLDLLGLASEQRLLDIGAGSGWPGLWLASRSRCEVVLTDPVAAGLRIASERAIRDGLGERCSVVAADAAALPFADSAFDAIHHADVLCCMDAKPALLRECRRVARTGSRMVFSVISLARQPADGAERALLARSGPPSPDPGEDYARLLARHGWNLRERLDATAEFVRCLRLAAAASHERREAVIALLGAQEFAERAQRRSSTLAAVARGLLVREIFVAD